MKRRIRWIRPRLQLRLLGAFGAIAVLSLLAQTLLTAALLLRFADRSGAGALAEALPGLLLQSLVLSLFVLLPALAVIGVRITFRIAGPVYRLETHLGSVAAGEQPGECRLRKGDELQDLCAALNLGLEQARREGPTTAAGDGAGVRAA